MHDSKLTEHTPQVCQQCGTLAGARWFREATAFDREPENWQFLCPACQEESTTYWLNAWDEWEWTRR